MVCSNSVLPQVRLLTEKEVPSPGFVARPYAVNPVFALRATWWPIQEHQSITDSGMVILWIPKADNLVYERGEGFRQKHIVHKKRWCDARIAITAMGKNSSRWFPIKVYFTVVSSIHAVMEAHPSRRLRYARLKRGLRAGVMVKRTQ